MARDNNHGNVIAALSQAPQQLDTCHFRHSYIGDNAPERKRLRGSQKRRRAFIGARVDLCSAQ